MPLLAHSARPKQGIPAQEYEKHVRAVEEMARTYARDAAQFWSGDRSKFEEAVAFAGRSHDLGKADEKNQAVLRSSAREKLAVPHEDAGVKYLMERGQAEAAALVYSHHAGFPNLLAELLGRSRCLRREPEAENGWVTGHVDERLPQYAELHHALFECVKGREAEAGKWRLAGTRWSGLTWRLALSCLVDADHGDTATNYRNEVSVKPPQTEWDKRLAALDRYVAGLSEGDSNRTARNDIRQLIYQELREHSDPGCRFYACDSPVGTGKTTAVMAHLLRAAKESQPRLRHIFVVLPYVNIINQSVETYRKALVLPGEDPMRAVVAHHHQADYQSVEARQLATLWDCPVTVTTAVQFFETLASNHPARLRKLHELPGSAIFIDEAHAAIPSWLWPQTWLWLRELTEQWGCHVVLASGSLARFWEPRGIIDPPQPLPELVSEDVRTQAQGAEQRRVRYVWERDPMGPKELGDYIFDKNRSGPRVVVLNTVQSAAILAETCREAGRTVFHLSTALAPGDRDAIVKKVKNKLNDKADRDWALIGTSCIEAGLDFDFRFAVREVGPTASMVQLGGRLNRNAEQASAVLAVVSLKIGSGGFTEHPALKTPAKILERCFEHPDVIAGPPAELCTIAMKKELEQEALGKKAEHIQDAEKKREFPEVAELYQVIDENTVTAVVDKELADRLKRHERVDPLVLLKCSVRVRRSKVGEYGLTPIIDDEVYEWTLRYDPELLGYMAGVLEAGLTDSGSFLGV
jgi:CRISPR-associated endonuclease/helicase Cas3